MQSRIPLPRECNDVRVRIRAGWAGVGVGGEEGSVQELELLEGRMAFEVEDSDCHGGRGS